MKDLFLTCSLFVAAWSFSAVDNTPQATATNLPGFSIKPAVCKAADCMQKAIPQAASCAKRRGRFFRRCK